MHLSHRHSEDTGQKSWGKTGQWMGKGDRGGSGLPTPVRRRRIGEDTFLTHPEGVAVIAVGATQLASGTDYGQPTCGL